MPFSFTIVPKSYQREGQPRGTENEFSHDRLTMIHRESDDLGKSKMAVFYVFKKTIGRTSEQYHNVHKYFCDSDVEDLTFPASLKGLILEHRSTT